MAIYIYIYLAPVCPLFWCLNTPKQRSFPIKTRVIWVPGIYIYRINRMICMANAQFVHDIPLSIPMTRTDSAILCGFDTYWKITVKRNPLTKIMDPHILKRNRWSHSHSMTPDEQRQQRSNASLITRNQRPYVRQSH